MGSVVLELFAADDLLLFIAPNFAHDWARVAVLPRVAVYCVVGQRRFAVGTHERASDIHFDLHRRMHSAVIVLDHYRLCPLQKVCLFQHVACLWHLYCCIS